MPDQEVSEISPSTAKLDPDSDECNCAARSIDKDLSTVAFTSTKNGYGMLEIEYGRTFFLREVIVYYWFYDKWFKPNNGCFKSVANFKACVDIHSDVDVSVYQGEVKQKSCGTLQLTYGLEQSDQIYTLVCNAVGDKVRFTKTTFDYLTLSEVVVSGADIGKLKKTSIIYHSDRVYKEPGTDNRIARSKYE